MHLALALLLTTTVAPLTPQQAHTIRNTEDSLIAPCCYTQSIALHMSNEAAEMRDQVTQMVTDGMTEQQILDHYKAIYGERILMVPDGRMGQMVYTFPVVTALLGILLLSLFIRNALKPRPSRAQTAPSLNVSRSLILSRIHAELGDDL